jgi:putative Mg2+ transporter-C (MgtC) family protein
MSDYSVLFERETLLTSADVLFRLVLAIVLGGFVGMEREAHGRPAGVRTHMLVCIGVVLFAEVSRFWEGGEARIVANIVTGIGFLGAGTIIRMGVEVRGLTTSASIWAVAAVGMAVAAGGAMIWAAVGATILILITLSVVNKLELSVLPGIHPRELLVSLDARERVVDVLIAIEKSGAHALGVRVARMEPGIELAVEVRGKADNLLTILSEVPGVSAAKWQQ